MEVHWLIEKIEKYHIFIRRAYNIIQVEIISIISINAMLQMVFKAVNNTASPYNLVPTLFIFGIYPYIVTYSIFSAFQQQ